MKNVKKQIDESVVMLSEEVLKKEWDNEKDERWNSE